MRRSSAGKGVDVRSLDEGDGLRFQDVELEKRWLHEGVETNVRNCAQTLLIVVTLNLMERIGRFCHGSRADKRWLFWLEMVIMSSCIVLLLRSIKYPKLRNYLPIFCGYSLFLLAHGLESFSSCEDLQEDFLAETRLEAKDRRVYLILKASYLDCTMQGHSVVQYVMTYIFVSPRLIPQFSLLWLNWCIVLLHTAASLVQQQVRKSLELPFYAREDIILTAFLLCVTACIAYNKKWYFEKSHRAKFASDLKQRDASGRIFHILEYMVPDHVILPMLKTPGKVIADPVDQVSILFLMIEDFDQHARSKGPEDLLKFLNCQFTEMDRICTHHSVTKIETVAEEYVCAVGVLPADRLEDQARGHAANLGRLISAAAAMLRMQTSGVRFKMGVHTGPVVAGVIGQKLPRFRLFGDTVNMAARLMQKGVPGKLQFGEDTRRQLPKWVHFTSRGEIELKGKGKVAAFLLDESHGAPRPSQDALVPERRHSMLEQVVSSLLTVRTWHQGPQQAVSPHEDDEEENFQLEQVAEGSYGGSESFSAYDSEGAQAGRVSLKTEPSSQEQPHPVTEVIDEKFEEVLRQLNAREHRNIHSWKWWCSLGLRTTDFTHSLEESWSRYFHDCVICKKLDYRLDRQATLLLVLTAVEMAASVGFDDAFEDEDWYGRDERGHLRLPCFLVCRLTSVLLVMAWQRAAKHRHWLVRQPNEAQLLMLVTTCVITVLMFCSYEAMANEEVIPEELNNLTEEQYHKLLFGSLTDLKHKRYRRKSASLSLVFVSVFLIFTAQHPFRFVHATVFPVLAAVLMLVCYLPFKNGEHLNLYIPVRCMLLLVAGSAMNASLQYQAERTSRLRFQAARSVSLTHERIQEILHTLLPPTVVAEIRERPLNAAPPTHKYRSAVIAQADLVGFTKLASTRRPEEVVQFIGELFGRFDDLTDRHSVYKVETVGDAYIAGQADLPLTQRCWPVSVGLFALEMCRATEEWSHSRGWSVACRVGIAYGECIGGIVGTDMQRYHLFGELMTCLEVLESTAPEGRVQVSQTCKEAMQRQMRADGIPKELLGFEPRTGEHLTTSKGEVHEYSAVGGPTFVLVSSASFRGWVGGT